MARAAQVRANRLNARKSTGPRTAGAEEDGGTAIGAVITEKSPEELRSSEETGRGRPGYEEASDDATTNGETPAGVTTNAEVAGPFCQTKPIEVSSVKCEVLSFKQEGRGPASELQTSNFTLYTSNLSGRSASALKRRCARCVYLISPVRTHPLRDEMEPQLILPLCMNHARMPGVIREMHPCECCPNFVARQEPRVGVGPPPPPAGPEVKYIPLGNHQFAIVDAANFAWLNRHRWFLLGGRSGLHYACRIERGKTIYMHREIMQTPPGMVVDHLNHNPVDNREGNLANRTQPENARNTRRGRSQSGFAGVYPCRKRWKAQIFSGGQIVYREIFDDPVEAARARDRKAYELFGAGAYLNFPDEILQGKEATG